MVRIRGMRMTVGSVVVAMHVAVLSLHRRVVHVIVVAIVVPVKVLMLEWRVTMAVAVFLGEVKVDGHGEKECRRQRRDHRAPLTERPRHGSADERRH